MPCPLVEQLATEAQGHSFPEAVSSSHPQLTQLPLYPSPLTACGNRCGDKNIPEPIEPWASQMYSLALQKLKKWVLLPYSKL